MKDADKFSKDLLEESKRFLEKAQGENECKEGQQAYLHAALVLGFSALESYINGIADEMLLRKEHSLLERSILSEKDISFENGEYKLTSKLKIYRLEDRILFLYRKYAGQPINTTESWWSNLKSSLKLRNELAHPKSALNINLDNTEKAIKAIIKTIDVLFLAVYKDNFILAKKGLKSTLSF